MVVFPMDLYPSMDPSPSTSTWEMAVRSMWSGDSVYQIVMIVILSLIEI